MNHPPVITFLIVGKNSPILVLAGLWHCYTHISYVSHYQNVNHQYELLLATSLTTINHHSPPFSYGFPMVFLFIRVLRRQKCLQHSSRLKPSHFRSIPSVFRALSVDWRRRSSSSASAESQPPASGTHRLHGARLFTQKLGHSWGKCS